MVELVRWLFLMITWISSLAAPVDDVPAPAPASDAAPVTVETPAPVLEPFSHPAVRLDVPDGVSVIETASGCVSETVCPYGRTPTNYYWAATRTIIVAPDQSERVLAHERCHAHQHGTVLRELGVEPAPDLREWYGTAEAQKWTGATADRAYVFHLSAYTPLEDFAETCALSLVQPDRLMTDDPVGYAAIVAVLSS